MIVVLSFAELNVEPGFHPDSYWVAFNLLLSGSIRVKSGFESALKLVEFTGLNLVLPLLHKDTQLEGF